MFGKSVAITLDKYQFVAGDTIKGTVELKLSKGVKAEGLTISLVVTEKTKRLGVSTRGASTSTSVQEVFRFDLPLDGEKEYIKDAAYPFEMLIPQEALPTPAQDMNTQGGILGKGLGMLASFSPLGNKTRSYKMEARLDIPWGIDATEKVDITIQG